jgi:hypothetical protein
MIKRGKYAFTPDNVLTKQNEKANTYLFFAGTRGSIVGFQVI